MLGTGYLIFTAGAQGAPDFQRIGETEMILPPALPAGSVGPTQTVPRSEDPLWKAAQALEQNFLSEMLKSAGLGAMEGAFGGGIGEEQFASYLREAQADAMVEAGGIGLAERLFHAMKDQGHDS